MEKKNLKLKNIISSLAVNSLGSILDTLKGVSKKWLSHEKQDLCNFSSLSVEEIINKKFHKVHFFLLMLE
jgi:hypothetical protein